MISFYDYHNKSPDTETVSGLFKLPKQSGTELKENEPVTGPPVVRLLFLIPSLIGWRLLGSFQSISSLLSTVKLFTESLRYGIILTAATWVARSLNIRRSSMLRQRPSPLEHPVIGPLVYALLSVLFLIVVFAFLSLVA